MPNIHFIRWLRTECFRYMVLCSSLVCKDQYGWVFLIQIGVRDGYWLERDITPEKEPYREIIVIQDTDTCSFVDQSWSHVGSFII